MSLQQLRRIKLFRKLDHKEGPLSLISETKKRSPNGSRAFEGAGFKLNKNKKYMLEEERNTEIERDNRMLYQKIVGHFHTDMESFKKSQTRRTKWSKKKDKERVTKSNLSPNDRLQRLVRSKSKRSKVTLNEMQPPRQRAQTILVNSRMQDAKTLFYGIDRIDGIEFKIKIFVANSTYYLIGKNHEVRLLLEMEEEEYMRLHRNELKGNPCAIFQFLEIVDNQVRFKTKVPEPNSITRKYFPKQLF